MGGDNALSQSSFLKEIVQNEYLILFVTYKKKFSSENITQWAHLMHEEKNIMKKKN
jgi:hypothetical protein